MAAYGSPAGADAALGECGMGLEGEATDTVFEIMLPRAALKRQILGPNIGPRVFFH